MRPKISFIIEMDRVVLEERGEPKKYLSNVSILCKIGNEAQNQFYN